MHITFFIYSLSGGGAERVTAHMANFWSQSAHTVTVLTMASTEDNRYSLPENVVLRPMRIDGVSSGPISALVSNFKRLAVLRKTIKEINPDITISMMTHANVMLALSSIGLKSRFIGAERNYPGFDYSGPVWGFLRKHTYRFLDTVVTQTETGKEWIQENTSARQVFSVANPIILPLPFLEPVVAPPKKSSRKLILGTGRLTSQKQFHHLIQVFSKLASDFDEWDLAILGEGQQQKRLTDLVSDLNISHRVMLPGRVGNIADWYKQADLFVMTSETEGFPNALIEAMAHGVAPISYDCLTGPSEIINHGENGFLVEAGNMSELESQMRSVMRDPSMRQLVAQNATKIVDTLDGKKIMSQWDKIISQSLTP